MAMDDSEVSEKLSQFFDQLLDDNVENSNTSVASKDKKKKKQRNRSESLEETKAVESITYPLSSSLTNVDVRFEGNIEEEEEVTSKKSKKKKKDKKHHSNSKTNEEECLDVDIEEQGIEVTSKISKRKKKKKNSVCNEDESFDAEIKEKVETNSKKWKKEKKMSVSNEDDEDLDADIEQEEIKVKSRILKQKDRKHLDSVANDNERYGKEIEEEGEDKSKKTKKKNIKHQSSSVSNEEDENFDANIEEEELEVKSKKSKKKKNDRKELDSKSKKSKNKDKNHPSETNANESETGKDMVETSSTTKNKTNTKKKDEKEKFTDDGFKIVSFVSDDDSDISDAFEYDSNDEESYESFQKPVSKNKIISDVSKGPHKMTDDGFKIVSEIPSDDSDVSDAFEEDEGLGMEQDGALESLRGPKIHRNIKKPILQIMDDFGIRDDIFLKQNKKPEEIKPPTKYKGKKCQPQASSLTLAAQKKGLKEVMVLDYAKKRGTGTKKRIEPEPEEEVEESAPQNTLDEKQLKRVRYDVFKLGMSGFNKEKREDTRVALAIRLGAKPPKKKAISYKDLLVMKKEEKKKEEEERELKKHLGLKVQKSRKPEEKRVVKAASSQVGRFRHGVQVLSKKDIARIQGSK